MFNTPGLKEMSDNWAKEGYTVSIGGYNLPDGTSINVVAVYDGEKLVTRAESEIFSEAIEDAYMDTPRKK